MIITVLNDNHRIYNLVGESKRTIVLVFGGFIKSIIS